MLRARSLDRLFSRADAAAAAAVLADILLGYRPPFAFARSLFVAVVERARTLAAAATAQQV